MTPQSPHYGVLKDVREALKSALDELWPYWRSDSSKREFEEYYAEEHEALKRLDAFIGAVPNGLGGDLTKYNEAMEKADAGQVAEWTEDLIVEAATLLHAAMGE
jgi:hypothetical protein